MEHNLLIMETGVDGLCARLPMSDIQPTPKPGEEKGEAGSGELRAGARRKTGGEDKRTNVTRPREDCGGGSGGGRKREERSGVRSGA